jgi:hypothetical protein
MENGNSSALIEDRLLECHAVAAEIESRDREGRTGHLSDGPPINSSRGCPTPSNPVAMKGKLMLEYTNRQLEVRAEPQSPARERSAFVPGLGIVRVVTATCDCGRRIEPHDVEPTGDGGLQVVCPSCHRTVFQIEPPPRNEAAAS